RKEKVHAKAPEPHAKPRKPHAKKRSARKRPKAARKSQKSARKSPRAARKTPVTARKKEKCTQSPVPQSPHVITLPSPQQKNPSPPRQNEAIRGFIIIL
ncbi:hypothetical protein Q75_16745, partial [Bacillus coahuilensis p1.1.43]